MNTPVRCLTSRGDFKNLKWRVGWGGGSPCETQSGMGRLKIQKVRGITLL